MANRVTQEIIKVLEGPGTPKARVTQETIKVLQGPGIPKARVTQLVIKILAPPPGSAGWKVSES